MDPKLLLPDSGPRDITSNQLQDHLEYMEARGRAPSSDTTEAGQREIAELVHKTLKPLHPKDPQPDRRDDDRSRHFRQAMQSQE